MQMTKVEVLKALKQCNEVEIQTGLTDHDVYFFKVTKAQAKKRILLCPDHSRINAALHNIDGLKLLIIGR